MLKLTVALAFSSQNDVHSIPSTLRQPAVTSFNGWDCEPRGVLGYIKGYVAGLQRQLPTLSKDDLGLNGSVKLCFEEEVDDEVVDTLVLSMSLLEALVLFPCWVETQSSKCLTWVCVEQVAEEFSQAKDGLGAYCLERSEDSYKLYLERDGAMTPEDIFWAIASGSPLMSKDK